MNNIENIKIAFNSIKSNWLRSLLTLSIIALGLMSLVGILTAIDGLLKSVNDNFNRIGSNSFQVERLIEEITSKTQGRTRKYGEVITYENAIDFKEKYIYPSVKVSIELQVTSGAVVRYRDQESDENVRVIGTDENNLDVSSYVLEEGRNFLASEIQAGVSKCIIGADVVSKIFNGKADKAIGKVIHVSDQTYKVIGVLESKGSTFGSSGDRRVLIPLTKARILYGSNKSDYSITTAVDNQLEMENAISAAIGTMRNVRDLKPVDPNDFKVEKSSGLLEEVKSLTSGLRWATIAIGLMTLIGAAIGLMNIMLVSVTERTKEIGISKALGATKENILTQFLTEATVITLIGGIIGIILGVIVGNGITLLLGGTFIFPVVWVSLGLFLCIVTGIASGLYPALKASRLDPIESLRYE